jgi:hypothetical protein
MKTFSAVKPVDLILKQCKEQGVPVNDHLYRTAMWDTIVIGNQAKGKKLGHVVFNTFNGRFSGVTDKGVKFTSDSPKHDNEPWMQALLNFFYTEKK